MKYEQPFYVPIGKGKLNLHTGQRGGYYLPALESPELENMGQNIPQEIIWNRREWDTVQQLQGRVLHCENKVTELLSSFKKRKRTKHFKEYV